MFTFLTTTTAWQFLDLPKGIKMTAIKKPVTTKPQQDSGDTARHEQREFSTRKGREKQSEAGRGAGSVKPKAN